MSCWKSFFVIFLGCVSFGSSKTYERCELARDLLEKFKFPADEVSQCKFDTPFFNYFTLLSKEM